MPNKRFEAHKRLSNSDKHSSNSFSKNNFEALTFDLLYGLIILFVLAIVPIIVSFANNIPTAPEEIALFRSPDFQMDFFSFVRSLCLKYATILLGCVFAVDFYRKNFIGNSASKLKDFYKRPQLIAYFLFFIFIFIVALVDNKSKLDFFGVNLANNILVGVPLYFFIFSPLAFILTGKLNSRIPKLVALAVLVFFFGVMLTMAFTDFKYLTFHGANERYENIYVVLGYSIIFVSVIQFADNARKLAIVMYGLLFSAAVLGLVGALQLLGLNFFTTNLAARLIYGKHYVDGVGINIHFTQSFSLLYNPNSLGLYASMISAFLFFTAVFLPRRSPLKYIFFTLFFLCALALIGSNSAAGIISETIVFAIGSIFVITFVSKLYKNTQKILIGGTLALIFLLLVTIAIPPINSRIKYFADKLFVVDSSYQHQFLKDLRTDGNTVELSSAAGNVQITYNKDLESIDVSFNNELVAPYQIDEPDEYGAVKHHFHLPGFGESYVLFVKELLSFNTFGFIYNFYSDGESLLYITPASKLFDINEEIPSLGFKGKETFANGRGYLWSRTLPLMKNALIKGYGIDAFAEAFPQHDVAGRIRHLGIPGMLIDKAHNGYLQIAVTSGVLSMIAVIFLIGYYLFRAFKNIVLRSDSNKFLFALKFGLVFGVAAYAIGFLSTDSIVGVSPMFWGLLGLGFAATQLSDSDKEE